MFIDTHAHLEMEQFDPDQEEVIERANKAGISHIINVATNLEDSENTIRLARKHGSIHAAVGIHPHEAGKLENHYLAKLKKLSEAPEVVAIGETGLDYYRNYSPRKAQLDLFKKLIHLAIDVNKPIIVHCREAWDDTLDILRRENPGRTGGIIHCFSGDKDKALAFVDLGFFISFAGPLTYPKSTKLQEAARAVPSERLFIETDCPYLPPQSKRGKRNEPSFLIETAEKLAEIKSINTLDLGRILLANMSNLFGIGRREDSERIVYKIRNSLYINVTSRCSNNCDFCGRKKRPVVAGYDLGLKEDPSANAVITQIGDPMQYDEIVFCGYGEPTFRLDFIKTVAKWVKERGGKVRINTNGHGNMIHGRNILPELKDLVDVISISLNSENEENYVKLCKPEQGKAAYQAVKEFIREAGKVIPEVIGSVVRVPGKVDVDQCENIITNELGASFRIREYNVVG